MKRKLTTILAFSLFLCSFSYAQVFVKQDAMGSNDGSSWDNAYTNLSTALSSASMGTQVWVAAGTYKPDGGNADAFFTFTSNIELYGGFAGTEANLSDRDWAMNPTILSGDHAGDDIVDNFTDNRTDNSRHVMWLTDTITAAVIDGFIFSNGQTEPGTSSGDFRRGGAILTYGSVTIRNCTFTQNYGYFGGSVYPRLTGADGTVIENCIFEKNQGYAGGAMYINSPTITIKGCTYTENQTTDSHGGAIYCTSRDGISITDCSFTGNTAGAANRGGAMYLVHTTGIVANCTFTNNKSTSSSAGAIMVRDNSDAGFPFLLEIEKCSFTGNSAVFGGAVGCYDEFSNIEVTDCLFESNFSSRLGGATTNGFQGSSTYTDCIFKLNTAEQSGGALFNQNNGSSLTVLGCELNQNSATNTGGAIFFGGNSDPTDTIPLPMLTVMNSIFSENSATDQAGAINISNGNFNLTNSIIHTNFATGMEAIGGGMSLNVSDSIDATYQILNSTIASNFSIIGANIANWQDGTGTSTLVLQNNILYSDVGFNYEIEAGTPTIFSAGGNLSSDTSLNSIFTAINDLNETDPLFVDISISDFKLTDNSPCINAGIPDDAPIYDLEGLPRLGPPDMGCYENQNVVSTHTFDKHFGTARIFPNPVQDFVNLTFESDWNGTLECSIIDQVGKVISIRYMDKNSSVLSAQMEARVLPSGIYTLKVSNGTVFNTVRFVK